MPYSKTYQGILDMILDTVLYVPTARGIVRRAGAEPGGVGQLPAPIVVWTFSDINEHDYDFGGVSTDRGWTTPYAALEEWQPFPRADSPAILDAALVDLSAASQMRLVASVTASFTGRLWVCGFDGTSYVSLVSTSEQPALVLDTVGLQWSEWFPILANDTDTEVHVVVKNEGEAEQDIGVGLVQVQVR